MRVYFALFLGSLLVLHPRVAGAQGSQIAQATPLLDLHVGFTPVGSSLERPALDRAGGGVAGGMLSERSVADERVWRAPVRVPLALPNPTLTLFIPEYLRAVLPRVRAVEPAPGPAATEAVAPSVTTPAVSAGVVRAQSETTYYEVKGQSREDIAAALRRSGPRLQGAQFFGLTEWKVSAEYRPATRPAGCATDDLTVHVAVRTHLPQWTSSDEAPAELNGAWARFITALDRHEHGHRTLAEEAAEVIRQRLATVHAPDCDELDSVAQREMIVVMQEYEAHNIDYDATTGHGRTQGAIWPPR